MEQWVSVDLRTGLVLADFTDLTVDTIRSVLCAYSTTTASFPLPTAPENWERATLECAVAFILLDDDQDGSDPRILWGGWVTRQERSLDDKVSLSLATLESYFDRRYVGNVTYMAASQTTIVSNLIGSFVNDGTINIRVQATASAVTRDRTYTDDSDKSILSVLTELASVDNGPEWTIGWEWQHSPERITPVLYVADRIGTAAPAGLGPASTFEAPGPVKEIHYVRDFAAGKGATRVMAVSSPSADVRPQSTPQVSTSTERPTIEYRFTPSTSITSTSVLNSHAQAALAAMAGGAVSITLTAIVDDAPRLAVDWFIGDDIGYRIQDSIPAFPNGLEGVARCVGWERTMAEPQTVSPILSGGL